MTTLAMKTPTIKTMALDLHHSTGTDRFEGLTSFVGEDVSGSFGLLPGHGRMMTALVAGIVRFRVAADEWHYLVLPGGILSGGGNVLTLCTRRYLHDTEFRKMGTLLTELQQADEDALGGIKESLHRLEEEMLRRLREVERANYE